MKKVFSLLSVLVLALVSYNCEEHDPSVNHPSFLSFDRDSRLIEFVTESSEYPLTVYASKVSNEDRVVNIVTVTGVNPKTNGPFTTAVDGDFVLGATSLVIPAGEMSASTTITFDPNLSLAAQRQVTFELQSSAEEFVFNSTTTRTMISYRRICFSNTVLFDLTLDPWGSEISWNIKNSSGAVVQSGGPYADGGAGLHIQPQMSFTLPDGNYTFTINDMYGDGLSGSTTSGPGSFKIAKDCGSDLVQGGGNFGASYSKQFSLP
jgi:hypothetical protein